MISNDQTPSDNSSALQSASTREKPEQQVQGRLPPVIRHISSIEDFKRNSNTFLTVLDSFGWLYYKLIFIFLILIKLIQAYKKNEDDKQLIEPPGPKGHFLLGVLPEFSAKGIINFSEQLWKTYGLETGICHYYIGSKHFYLITNPEYIKKIVNDPMTFARGDTSNVGRYFFGDTIVSTEGDIWKNKSHTLFAHLSPQRIKQYHECIIELAQDMCSRWLELERQGKPITNLSDEMSAITALVISRSLLNMDLNKEQALGKALKQMGDHFLNLIYVGSIIPPQYLEKLPVKFITEFKQASQELSTELGNAIKKYIAEDRATGDYYIDERIREYKAELKEGIISKALVDDITMIFIVGHETTAKLMVWLLFELAQNQTVAEKLYEEISSVLEGKDPQPEDLAKLPYLTKVLQETLRFYPIISPMLRDVMNDFQLGPYVIKKGSLVQIGTRLMIKDPKIWDTPEEFSPDRFTNELTNLTNQYFFTPFHSGPHRCTGKHLALLEAKLFLIKIMQNFQFTLIENHPPIYPTVKLAMEPDKPVQLKLMWRQPLKMQADLVTEEKDKFISISSVANLTFHRRQQQKHGTTTNAMDEAYLGTADIGRRNELPICNKF